MSMLLWPAIHMSEPFQAHEVNIDDIGCIELVNGGFVVHWCLEETAIDAPGHPHSAIVKLKMRFTPIVLPRLIAKLACGLVDVHQEVIPRGGVPHLVS